MADDMAAERAPQPRGFKKFRGKPPMPEFLKDPLKDTDKLFEEERQRPLKPLPETPNIEKVTGIREGIQVPSPEGQEVELESFTPEALKEASKGVLTHKEEPKTMNRRTFLRLGTGVAAIATTAAVESKTNFIGRIINAFSGGKKDNKAAAPFVTETPKTVVAPATANPTQVEPTVAATPTEAPKVEPTKEKILTLEEQLPYEIAENSKRTYKGKYITIHFGVDKEVQSKTTYVDGPFGEKPFIPMNYFELSGERLSEVIGRQVTQQELIDYLENGVLEGHLLLLKELNKDGKYSNWTLDMLKDRISRIRSGENLEHPKYTVPGGAFRNGLGGAGATIDASAENFYLHKISKPGYNKLTSSSSFNFRMVGGGTLVLEEFDTDGAAVNDNSGLNRNSFAIGIIFSNGFGLATQLSLQDGDYHAYNEELARKMEAMTALIRNNFVPYQEIRNFAGIFKVK